MSAVAVPVAAFAAYPSPMASEDPAPDPSGSPPATDPPTTPPPDSPPPGGSPGPPQSPPPYDPAPSLTVRLSLSAITAAPGGSVTATAKVSARQAIAHHTVVRFSASSASVGGSIALGDLGGGERSASSIVRIPAGHADGSIVVTASLSADKASTRSATGKITVSTVAGGGSALVNVPGSDPALSLSVPIPGMPGSAAALGGAAQAQLPLIAQQPATAPGLQLAARPVSLRTNTSPLGLDTISYRLFWTQVAWLTSLLVGVSLLLTQLRLNRRRIVVRVVVRGSRRAPRQR
ncbi:MAG: hypothetical protein ACRDP6_16330 [Actinoallomurus sp.]